MSDKAITPNKIFSGTSLMQLIHDVENETKATFDSEATQIKLSFFLLVRKAFNDAYEKIKDHLSLEGKAEVGESFSGITGEYVQGSYTERGGAEYEVDPNVEEANIDPNFFTKETVFKVNKDEVKKYVKQYRELPEGIRLRNRKKSLAIAPTKMSKALFEQMNDTSDDVFYDLDIPEITDGELNDQASL